MDVKQAFAELGLRPSASAIEIDLAYRRLINKWHPDKYQNAPEMLHTAVHRTKRLNLAYEYLNDYLVKKKNSPDTPKHQSRWWQSKTAYTTSSGRRSANNFSAIQKYVLRVFRILAFLLLKKIKIILFLFFFLISILTITYSIGRVFSKFNSKIHDAKSLNIVTLNKHATDKNDRIPKEKKGGAVLRRIDTPSAISRNIRPSAEKSVAMRNNVGKTRELPFGEKQKQEAKVSNEEYPRVNSIPDQISIALEFVKQNKFLEASQVVFQAISTKPQEVVYLLHKADNLILWSLIGDSLESIDVTIHVTPKIEDFLAEHMNLILHERVSAINPKTAEVIVRYAGKSLQIPRITTLSQEIARHLARYKGRLSLNGLTSISAKVAEAFSDFNGTELSMTNLKIIPFNYLQLLPEDKIFVSKTFEASFSIEDAVQLKEEVNRNIDKVICLKHVKSLSTATANLLAEIQSALYLNAINHINEDVAQALSKHNGSLLSLDGLGAIDEKTAELLMNREGKLSLNGLHGLTDGIAELFAKYRGSLALDGIKKLTQAQIESLARHNGRLSLNGLTWLSTDNATLLINHKGGLSLDGLTQLNAETAKVLAASKYPISLNGLKLIPASVAKQLCRHKDTLTLNGVIHLDLATAEVLITHEGWIHLNGITEISDQLATVLTTSKSGLWLQGLKNVSARALEILKTNALIRLPAEQQIEHF